MGRTLSLLVALVCLSTPELARQMMGDALLVEAGGGGRTPGVRSSLERSRVSFRSLPDCLKAARQSSVHAFYHWAWTEAGAATGSPLIEWAHRPSSLSIVSPSGLYTFSLFERPPPAA